mmetsp:Transcript_7989/g.12680  ORF Transcript_7989/g.12680 Transcript_7989/m.12680 type:complete len:82 (+) Transcript_7989:212-457(+)
MAPMLTSELLPNRARSLGMSVSMTAMFVANTLVQYSFPIARKHFGMPVTLNGYALIVAIGWVFVALLVPETKGLSLESVRC